MAEGGLRQEEEVLVLEEWSKEARQEAQKIRMYR